MSLRVVLYAEGARELGGLERADFAPGSPLPEDALGAAHVLVRRGLGVARRIPEPAVRFEAPLRTDRGTVARGAQIAHPKTLRRLLTWVDPAKRPDLAVVLLDADGKTGTKESLRGELADLAVSKVVAVSVQEFEAWLAADGAAVRSACPGSTFELAGMIESLDRGEAKTALEAALAAGGADVEARRARRVTVARTCDLDTVRRRCPAFGELLDDLRPS